MGELKLFTNEQFGSVRAVKIGETDYLVGEDVVKALRYSKKYYDVIKQHCDKEDYILLNKETQPQNGAEFDYKQLGQRGGYLINESALYSLVFGSDMKEAKQFKHWVTSEILPTIRQHGAYMTENTIEKCLTDPDFLIKLATQLKEEKQKRKLAEDKLQQQKPLIEFVDTVTNSSDSIDMNDMAKLIQNEGIKLGRNKLFALLRDNKILMKNNQPYQRFMDCGYFKIIETTKSTPYGDKIFTKTLVTGKGQVFIVQFVKDKINDK